MLDFKVQSPTKCTEQTLSTMSENSSKGFVIQQKFDGIRLLVDVRDMKMYSKSGQETTKLTQNQRQGIIGAIDVAMKGMVRDKDFVLDGEWLEGSNTYKVFDAKFYDEPDNLPYNRRAMILNAILNTKPYVHAGQEYYVSLTSTTGFKNLDLMLKVAQESNWEGLIIRPISLPYGQHGFKYKLKTHVDCVVMNRDIFTEQLVLGMTELYPESGGMSVVSVGHVDGHYGPALKYKTGDIVQVEVLYATPRRRLVQPTNPVLREDLTRDDCHISQLDPIIKHKE